MAKGLKDILHQSGPLDIVAYSAIDAPPGSGEYFPEPAQLIAVRRPDRQALCEECDHFEPHADAAKESCDLIQAVIHADLEARQRGSRCCGNLADAQAEQVYAEVLAGRGVHPRMKDCPWYSRG